MTQDEITIAMAREAGFEVWEADYALQGQLERFADLVAAHERERMWCDAEFARQQEREACAKVCEELDLFQGYGDAFAAAIRARGGK